MKHVIVVAMLALCSCSAIKDYAKDTAREVVAEVQAEAARRADTNADGTTTTEEWAEWIKTGGAGTVVLIAFEYLRRRMKKKVGELWSELKPLADDKLVRTAVVGGKPPS